MNIEEKEAYQVNYTIGEEKFLFRRANYQDDFAKIIELIYKTDDYIYPSWFNGDIEEAKRILPKYMIQPGFIFNYNNMYIAINESTNEIVGLVCAIDYTTDLSFDYSELENYNDNYKITINNYLKELIKLVQSKKTMYVVNCCVDEKQRGKGIAKKLLGSFTKLMEQIGYDQIEFDCLSNNEAALHLYSSLGYGVDHNEVSFDGYNVVYFIRHTGDSDLEQYKSNKDSKLKM